MHTKPKKRTAVENGDELGLGTTIANGEDLGPIVRHAFEHGKPDTLLHQLKNVVKKKEIEIEDLCRLHYEDFIYAVDELHGVLVDADELKNGLMSGNFRLQEGSMSLLLKLEEFLESHSIMANITEAIKRSRVCLEVSGLCAKCNRDIANDRFYPALKTLDIIERDYLQKIPVKALFQVIETKIPVIKSHIEKKVINEFHDWLVMIRGAAKEIGQQAIRQAVSARQREEDSRARQREAEEQSRSVVAGCEYALDMEDMDEDVGLNFDLTPVYRAYHIHTCLGLKDQFQNYYYKNRSMQLNLDMQISPIQPFLESHQIFFAQIAGYFIIEDRVLRTAGTLLAAEQVESVWETTVSKVSSLLEEQFSLVDSANDLLVIKDNVTLLAGTLKRYGYRVSSLLEILGNSRDKYHALLLEECRTQIDEVLSRDTYEQMVIKREYEYNMNVLAFQLQTSDIMPAFPYIAPFSVAVPDCCRIIRSFIEGSVSYSSFGDHMAFYDIVKRYLDKLLVDVLNEALRKIINCGTSSVSQAMQIAANLTVLEHACDFFLKQAAQSCGLPVRLTEKPRASSMAREALKASQDAAYNALLKLVNTKIDEFMSLTENINWTSNDIVQNEYMNEVTIYLDTLFSTAQQVLPMEAMYKVGNGAFKHISDSIVGTFLSDNVKRFTLHAVMSIDDDLKTLEAFADERFESSGLDQINIEGSLRDCLIEARQLVNLLLSNQPENFMNPVIRERSYSSFDHKKVAAICEKFKDTPDRLFGSLGSRASKQDARKKSMDVLKKRLKDLASPICSHRGRSKPCSLVSLCLGVFGQHLEDILPEICEIAPILPSHIKHAIVAIARRRKLLQDDCLIALADHTWNVLDISGSDVTNAGIAKVSKICTNLRAVDISLCDRVTEEAVCCLIRHCHSLETLRCGGSPASHFTAKCSLKYLLPTLQKVEEDHWEELDNREIISGAPSLRWLVWPKIDDQCRKILSTDCPRISINPKPSLISHRGSEIPWEAFPDIVLDDPIVEDLDPKTWSLASNGASRIRSQATSGTFELPIAEKFRLAFEERDARLAPKRAKNVRQHKRRAEKERLMSNVNAKSFLLASKAKNFL